MGKSNYYDKMEWQDSIKMIITQKLHQIRNWEFQNMLYGMSTIEIIENLLICQKIGWYDGSDDRRRIDYVNQLQQPVADQSPTNLELLFLYFSIICIFQDQMYIHFVWQPCVVVDGCWCCIENLWTTKTARRSSTTICRPSKTTRKKGGCRRSARGCRCNSLTTSHRSSTNICRPPTTSGNHPKNSGC